MRVRVTGSIQLNVGVPTGEETISWASVLLFSDNLLSQRVFLLFPLGFLWGLIVGRMRMKGGKEKEEWKWKWKERGWHRDGDRKGNGVSTL